MSYRDEIHRVVFQAPLEGIGVRIAEAIDASGKSKAQVARDCGLRWQTINNWCKDENALGMRVRNAVALSESLGVSLQWLVTGFGDPRW